MQINARRLLRKEVVRELYKCKCEACTSRDWFAWSSPFASAGFIDGEWMSDSGGGSHISVQRSSSLELKLPTPEKSCRRVKWSGVVKENRAHCTE